MPDPHTPDIPQSSPQEINWSKELRYETSGLMYCYVLPKEPDVVERMVTAAVFKLLSGRDVSNREEDRFIEGSPRTIPDEQTEVMARDLFDQVRKMLSEDNNYKYEWDEAVKQGNRAKQWLTTGEGKYGFSEHYDYWQLRPIKETIFVDTDKEDEGVIQMRVVLPEVAQVKGFPTDLLSRSLKPEQLKKMGIDQVAFLERVAGKFGLDMSSVIQGMYNDEIKSCFVRSLNENGHTEFDDARKAIVYSGDKGHPEFSPTEQYEMLTDSEKELTQKPRDEHLNARMGFDLTSGNTTARFQINFWGEGEAWFNPNTMSMEGRLLPGEQDAFYLGLYPKIQKGTTHAELLDLRQQAIKLADELGFPQKTSYW